MSSVHADNFVCEHDLQDSLMQMLIRFSPYCKRDYHYIDSRYGCFKGENTMANDEKGVRTNADLSMICAFLTKFGGCHDLDSIAYKTLCYAVDTHKAIRKTTCKNGKYWGSMSSADNQWESSLWAMSVAYSAYFQWNRLSDEMKRNIHTLLSAECNYELERTIPTGYKGDTKAEENGWEVDVLAATLGLFPDDEMADKWFRRMREFAINSYSHPSDSKNNEIIDSWYDNSTVASLYRGANLYDDWTLQNHNFFHTSYQNVVIQELGEARLALKLFQGKNEKWKSNALLHNCDSVTDNVINWLTLPDGEQAMPNGNDWSLFLYDQITSYSTMACMEQDRAALLFENKAYEQIRHRQLTTKDGTWLLRPDVGARRMGVQAHRVMMSWLMHNNYSTATLNPMKWNDFVNKYSKAKIFPCQNIVRSLHPDYFACFSFSKGKKSFTGYIAPINADNNNIVIPYRKYNTGNIVGYYQTKGNNINARLAGEPVLSCNNADFTVSATLLENDSSLARSFTITTNDKGITYDDNTRVLKNVTINKDCVGLLAVSTDEFTSINRNIEYNNGRTDIDGGALMVEANTNDKASFTDRSVENSIYTTKLYPYGNRGESTYKKGSVLAKHKIRIVANMKR